MPLENPRSFHVWVRNQFGEKLFSIFFRTYTEKVWGMSCDEISADWAVQRIQRVSLASTIWNSLSRQISGGLFGSSNRKKVQKTLIESFRYPRKGPGMMWERCAEKIRA